MRRITVPAAIATAAVILFASATLMIADSDAVMACKKCQPTPTPTITPTATPTSSPTATSTAVNISVQEPTPTPTPTPTSSATTTGTAASTTIQEPTPTPTPTPTSSPTTTGTAANTSTLDSTADDGKGFAVGPMVKIRPVIDQIDSSSDGLIELFFSNPSLNQVTLEGELYVSTPSGIYMYGNGFELMTSTGTSYVQFNVSPGKQATYHINFKADETMVGRTCFVHLSGQYWPDGDRDDYNVISLTHPLTVVAASPGTGAAQVGNVEQVAGTGIAGISIVWWILLAVIALGGIAIIAAVRSR